MEQYSGFAEVYDLFMDNVPYDNWARLIHSLLRENGVRTASDKTTLKAAEKAIKDVTPDTRPLICELGCGTGKMTRRLRDLGYDMIGVDISDEMLRVAYDKEAQLGKTDNSEDSILYLCQDMCEFELYGTVAAVVSVCDSLNYITESGDLAEVFRLVNNYLDINGVFVFDLHTPYYYKKVLGERTICENRDEGSFIWENYYDSESHINEYDMTIYYREEQENEDCDTYIRCEETHYQRAYSIAEIKRMLKAAGLEVLKVLDETGKTEPAKDSERIYVVARTTKLS